MKTIELETPKQTSVLLQSTGAEAVIQSLKAEGVKTIFGYPGGAIMPIYDALFDHLEEVNHVLTRHEQGAIHAAQGYARTSGKTGVVFATSGPGATNLTQITQLKFFEISLWGNPKFRRTIFCVFW